MSETLLRVENLTTELDLEAGVVRPVDKVSFTINRGENVAILGESGCGKSMTALSLFRLAPEPVGRVAEGEIWLGDTDLMKLSEREMRTVRGSRMAMIFQEPQTSLNPVMTIGDQITEALKKRDTKDQVDDLKAAAIKLLSSVGIADADKRVHEYPHQLSGGMKQRVMIAMALASQPELLVADEPTTALDVTIQAQILDLLSDLQKQTRMSVLLITHDLGVVAKMADRVLVMYAGEIIEEASREAFFSSPLHPYSQRLFKALPGRGKRGSPLEVIPGRVPPLTTKFKGCRFFDRCDQSSELCRNQAPEWTDDNGHRVRCFHVNRTKETKSTVKQAAKEEQNEDSKTLLSIKQLKVHFPIQKGVFKHVVGYVRAVDGVSIDIAAGKTVALVGESGCGKTTVGKAALQLIPVTGGAVQLDGLDLVTMPRNQLRQLRKQMQIIFQDPFSSLNPRMLVGDIVSEGLLALEIETDRTKRDDLVDDLLNKVGLDPEARFRYPHEFSGGQRQRISIARALAVCPRIIVCDEPTSALDVSVQAQILNLLKQLQDDMGLAYLFISHDLSVVEYLAHEIAVMYLGRIIEYGTVADVLDKPKHPYTQALLSAVPVIETAEAGEQRKIIKLTGDMPSPINPPSGCHFHPRCPKAKAECSRAFPSVKQFDGKHWTSCHLYC